MLLGVVAGDGVLLVVVALLPVTTLMASCSAGFIRHASCVLLSSCTCADAARLECDSAILLTQQRELQGNHCTGLLHRPLVHNTPD